VCDPRKGGERGTHLSVLRKISLRRDSPSGLYLRLNLSKPADSIVESVSGARGELEVAEKRRRTVERVLVGVHVKRVDREVVRRHVERLEHLAQREMLAVSEDDDFLLLGEGEEGGEGSARCGFSWLLSRFARTHISRALHLRLDESEYMLLVGGRRVVDVSVDLADVVEVAVRDALRTVPQSQPRRLSRSADAREM